MFKRAFASTGIAIPRLLGPEHHVGLLRVDAPFLVAVDRHVVLPERAATRGMPQLRLAQHRQTATPRGPVRDEAQRIVPEAALCQTFFEAVPKFPSW